MYRVRRRHCRYDFFIRSSTTYNHSKFMAQELSSACAQIIYQVRSELAELVEAGETGQIVVHCGRHDIAVEVIRKLKAVPLQEKPPPPK